MSFSEPFLLKGSRLFALISSLWETICSERNAEIFTVAGFDYRKDLGYKNPIFLEG